MLLDDIKLIVSKADFTQKVATAEREPGPVFVPPTASQPWPETALPKRMEHINLQPYSALDLTIGTANKYIN